MEEVFGEGEVLELFQAETMKKTELMRLLTA